MSITGAALPLRGLIQSLVARELKARYRGRFLGSSGRSSNPLLLLLVYSFVFTYVMTAAHDKRVEPYALSGSAAPALDLVLVGPDRIGRVLISGGNLNQEVSLPRKILPIVSVLANMIHFFFGLPFGRLPVVIPSPANAGDARALSSWSCSCSWC